MKQREDRKNSPFEDRKRFCPFSKPNSPKIDYKDVKMLTRFISEKGKISPSRITNVSNKKQKELAKAITSVALKLSNALLTTPTKEIGTA